MSLVTERIENNVLYLELNGRIDSSNADQAEELIKAIKEAHPDLQSVLMPKIWSISLLRAFASFFVCARMRRI